MKINKITVLIRGWVTDFVSIQTTLPSPFSKEVSSGFLVMKFETQKGKGVQYVRDNFNIEPEVIIVN